MRHSDDRVVHYRSHVIGWVFLTPTSRLLPAQSVVFLDSFSKILS